MDYVLRMKVTEKHVEMIKHLSNWKTQLQLLNFRRQMLKQQIITQWEHFLIISNYIV